MNRLRDKKDDINVQREVLGVLVRTLESEHHLMEQATKDDATQVLVELQTLFLEPKNEIEDIRVLIEEDCRLGLGS